jgi:excisionase family DNA binding protein
MEIQRKTPRLLLTIEEAAELLGCGRTLMYDLVRRREVRTIKLGRLRRIPREAIDDFITRHAA